MTIKFGAIYIIVYIYIYILGYLNIYIRVCARARACLDIQRYVVLFDDLPSDYMKYWIILHFNTSIQRV